MTAIAEKLLEAAGKTKGTISRIVLRQKDTKVTEKKASTRMHPENTAKAPAKTTEKVTTPATTKLTRKTHAEAMPTTKTQQRPTQEQAPNYEIPVDLTAALLTDLKQPRRYRIVRALITKQAVRMMLTGDDGYLTEEYMQNLFTKLGDWINEAARKARVKLPLDLIEKAFYAEMQENTGMDFSKMAGLINRTAPAHSTITATTIGIRNPETNNRLVRKFTDKLRTKNRSRNHAGFTNSAKKTHERITYHSPIQVYNAIC